MQSKKLSALESLANLVLECIILNKEQKENNI